MKHVDVVIISWAKDNALLQVTKDGLNSLFKSEEDIEFSKKLIVEKKTLLRKKNSLRNNEGYEYTKFFEKNSEVNNIKIAEEEFVTKKQNNIN